MQLSRMAVRPLRGLPASAFRGDAASGGNLQGQGADQGVPGSRQSRAAVGLPGSAAGPAASGLGSLLFARLQANRYFRDSVQLVPVPGKLDRPCAFRMAAL